MKPKPPINESKSDKFKRLATQRTNEVINKLHVLGNCSNRSIYDYSEEDISKIFNAVEKQLKEVKLKFTYTKRNKKEFKL